MAKSEFTEMQYVLGFVSEFMRNLNSSTGQTPLFMLPSPYEEQFMGFDIWIEHFSHMEFHQYKRSDYLSNKTTKEIKRGLSTNYLPYYRFKLYNDSPSFQFTRLCTIADMFPQHRVYYIAPKFHKLDEFNNYFWRNEIIKNSIFINCSGFNSARIKKYLKNNPGEHTIAFDKTNSRYLFSEGIRMYDEYNARYEKVILKGGRESFQHIVKKLFYQLSRESVEDSSKELEISENDVRTQFTWVRTTLLIKYNINMIPINNNIK